MTFLIASTWGNVPVIKQIAWILGYLMQGIFIVLSHMGILSVAACIIVFTIITKMILLPLTINQQKFTKVNALMTPELQELNKKYANKKDQASLSQMQVEQRMIYDKYGTSTTAGCLPTLIQLPILFALYRVYYSLENYIPQMDSYTEEEVQAMYMFLGINLMNSPGFKISAALLIPILAGLISFLSMKLTMVNQGTADANNQMASSMKMMNYTMPLISIYLCISLPAFLGLYWVSQSLVMMIQQMAINRYMKKITVEDLIKQNIEKQNKKRAKKGLPPLSDKATVNTKNIARPEPEKKIITEEDPEEREKKIQASTEYYRNKSKAALGSIAAKANMVRDYNERTSKKK